MWLYDCLSQDEASQFEREIKKRQKDATIVCDVPIGKRCDKCDVCDTKEKPRIAQKNQTQILI